MWMISAGRLLLFFFHNWPSRLFFYFWNKLGTNITFQKKIDLCIINFIVEVTPLIIFGNKSSVLHKESWFSYTHLENHWLYDLGKVGYGVYF